MFDKFGKMNYDELIRTAKAEKEEGDEEALIALAQENGLDPRHHGRRHQLL